MKKLLLYSLSTLFIFLSASFSLDAAGKGTKRRTSIDITDIDINSTLKRLKLDEAEINEEKDADINESVSVDLQKLNAIFDRGLDFRNYNALQVELLQLNVQELQAFIEIVKNNEAVGPEIIEIIVAIQLLNRVDDETSRLKEDLSNHFKNNSFIQRNIFERQKAAFEFVKFIFETLQPIQNHTPNEN